MQSNKSNSKPVYRVITYYLAALILITVGIRYALPLRDSDIWFHLMYGRYFIENLTLIPDHTIYSWTPTTNDSIYCTWLSDIFLYALYSVGDLPALFIFRYICVFLVLAAGIIFAKSLDLLSQPLTWLLLLLSLLMADAAFFAKPEVLTLIFMTAFSMNWWSLKTAPDTSWKRCYLFPLLMLIWVNSHGGFIFGYIFLACISVGEILNIKLQNSLLPRLTQKHLLFALLICSAMILFTPYGYKYPLDLATNIIPSAGNMQYQSYIMAYFLPMTLDPLRLDFADLANFAVIIFALISIPLIRKRKIDLSILTANLVFALLYTCFNRTTFYWAPVYLFSTLSLLAQSETYFSSPRKQLVQQITICLAFLFLVFSSIRDSYCYPHVYMHVGFGAGDSTPVSETRFIKENFPGLNIGNTYNQGSYLLWTLWPGNKVMIDSRHFPYRAWSWEFFRFTMDPEKYSSFPEEYKADIWCVGLQKPQLYLWFLQSPSWKLAYYGKNAAVFTSNHIKIPSTKPQGDLQTLGSINNTYSGLAALRFALAVQDNDGAERIVNRMKNIAGCRHFSDVAESASLYKRAVESYFSGQYRETVELLQNDTASHFITNQPMLADSYTHLAQRAWETHEPLAALEFSSQALNAQRNASTLYNYGVIYGFITLSNKQEIKQNRDGEWQAVLAEAVKSSKDSPDREKILQTAGRLLGNKPEAKPQLIVPKPGRLLTSGQIVFSNL